MKSTFLKFLLLSIALLLVSEIANQILNYKELLYNSLAERLTNKQIQHFFEFQDKWQWVGYVIVSLMVLIKTSIIASVLHVGVFFFSKVAVTFKQLWGFVLSAEFVFLLVPVFKIIWFYFFQTNYKLEDM